MKLGLIAFLITWNDLKTYEPLLSVFRDGHSKSSKEKEPCS